MSVTINIDMVADLLGLERIRKGYAPPGTFNVVCPFCGDRRGKMNLVVDHGGKHNLYNCYNCTEKGTMYDLYARVMGLTGTGDLTPTRQAAKEIRSCPIKQGPSGKFQPASFFNQPLGRKASDYTGTIHSADLLHKSLRNGLVIGNHSQNLHSCLG